MSVLYIDSLIFTTLYVCKFGYSTSDIRRSFNISWVSHLVFCIRALYFALYFANWRTLAKLKGSWKFKESTVYYLSDTILIQFSVSHQKKRSTCYCKSSSTGIGEEISNGKDEHFIFDLPILPPSSSEQSYPCAMIDVSQKLGPSFAPSSPYLIILCSLVKYINLSTIHICILESQVVNISTQV